MLFSLSTVKQDKILGYNTEKATAEHIVGQQSRIGETENFTPTICTVALSSRCASVRWTGLSRRISLS